MDRSTSKPRLREQVQMVMRLHHYSIRTEKSYWYWIRYFIRFHHLRHPLEMGAVEVNAFLSWLAVERKVAAATQNLALNALVFLYARVLQQPLGQVGDVVRAKRSTRIPTVLTHAEASEIIALLVQPHQLLASLMYGAGLRVVEAARLRVKDLDFDRQVITIHDGKGGKDRTTLLPTPLIGSLLERKQRIFNAWKRLCPKTVLRDCTAYADKSPHPSGERGGVIRLATMPTLITLTPSPSPVGRGEQIASGNTTRDWYIALEKPGAFLSSAGQPAVCAAPQVPEGATLV